MNACRKRGEVYLQHQKHGEKWKRYWLALHPASSQSVARLELSETAHERSTVVVKRHPERKVIRLSDCVSVVKLPPHAEACPGDNMAAFCVETESRKLVFATERQSCGEWVEMICNIAFQKHSNTSTQHVPLMEDNQIYMSTEQLSTFKVVLLPTEASVRCCLKGQYWLLVDEEVLVLQDPESKKTVMEWPYALLRRYGRDKMLFSLEAGRRCESGPGTFNFETRQSDGILHLIESAIRQQKSLTVTRGKQSPHSPRSRSPRSPLPKRPQSYIESNSSPNRSEISENVYSKSADALDILVHTTPASPIGSTEPVKAKSADSSSSSKSTHSDLGGGTCFIEPVYMDPIALIGKHEPVYAEPGELIKCHQTIKKDESTLQTSLLFPDFSEPVYSDPADVIRCCPNPAETVHIQLAKATSNKGKQQEAVYSEVYDHVKLNLDCKKADHRINEPIYSVPDIVTNQNKNSLPDRIEVIYSTVNKPPKTPQDLQEKRLCQTPEIVYEDLGTI
ncbi:docking protein 2 [Triplophysa dalaica]|uniref:docking protein 2 n=1 Tax=Triplophysa dalaica TaxID=1582913 RepID=UPI0024DFF716|nr:docking protein 2 [Triplophysa dalaica]